jgi:lipoprotein-anchoring transpeptidase ErfK/SrfK
VSERRRIGIDKTGYWVVMRMLLLIFSVTAAGALLAACGMATVQMDSQEDAPHQAALHVPAPLLTAQVTCDDFRPSAARAYAARVLRRVAIRGGGQLPTRDANGYRTVVGVLSAHVGPHCRPVLLHVQLPGPPNGRAGWIAARSVRVFPVVDRIVVDLSGRRLYAFRRGRLRLRTRVAVGAPRTPTPTGRFVVNERWVLHNPTGVFGVAALGISAHSNVLHNWLQRGPIGLHGTNEPWTIGRAASHGCIRLRNAEMRRLFRLAPAGTAVLIRR